MKMRHKIIIAVIAAVIALGMIVPIIASVILR